jgi:hypothetical protein
MDSLLLLSLSFDPVQQKQLKLSEFFYQILPSGLNPLQKKKKKKKLLKNMTKGTQSEKAW